MRGVLIFGGISTAAYILWHLNVFRHVMGFDRSIFSFLGIVLSILLVFRTNSAYDRWWEGRKQWGALVNHCRNLAIQLHVCIPATDRESRSFLSTRIANFCFAFKEHLRSGTDLSQLVNISDAEKSHYGKFKHVPNIISREIQSKVESLHRSDQIAQQFATVAAGFSACGHSNRSSVTTFGSRKSPSRRLANWA